MSEQTGDKTEQATPKRLEEAQRKGQFARSAEVQTAFVFVSGLGALVSSGSEIWRSLGNSMLSTFAHLHEMNVSEQMVGQYFVDAIKVVGHCTAPVVVAAVVAGLFAGVLQTRFRTSPEAMEMNWERVNPMNGFTRMFSARAAVPALVGIVKLGLLVGLSAGAVERIMRDPMFYTPVDVARIATFMADSAVGLGTRLVMGVIGLAAIDYGYNIWQNQRDMMMTKQEVKDEFKSQEGNPQVKSAMRRRKRGQSARKMLADVPKADVVVTNPTHLAVALRYDRKTMRAPIVIAKGSRLNALRIREIAKANQVPVIENKPLARMMFKHTRVGGEIPAEVYAAVAEILAYVYRTNAYRYYREQSQPRG